ncbi:unnamed protein product [Phytomonas sp. EM1]|nr:unnamed protein product [Phytomonas sp. EM1]|eukprot:CCW62177.1 unnamed protein product [Phytomonas sp. isolate EM1]
MNPTQEVAFEETVQWTSNISSGDIVRGLPLHILLAWALFVRLTRGVLSKTIDFGIISSFLSEDIKVDPGCNYVEALAQFQTIRFGNEPFCVLHQRCLRWTLLLVFWINRRLHSPVFKGSDMLHEIEVYRDFFAPIAKPVLPPWQYCRVVANIRALFCASIPPPLKKRHTSSLVGPKPAFNSAFEFHLYKALGNTLDTLQRDSFHVRWDYINPRDLLRQTLRRLERVGLANIEAQGYANKIEGAMYPRLHSETFSSLWFFLEASVDDTVGLDDNMHRAISVTMWEALLQCLEKVFYVMLTKIECGFIERCYYTLPFMMDCLAFISTIELKLSCSKGIPPATYLRFRDQISELFSMVRVLQVAVQKLYTMQSKQLLAGDYKSSSKPFTTIPPADALPTTREALKISAVALQLLAEVVEPTLCILRPVLLNEEHSKEAENHRNRSETLLLASDGRFAKMIIHFLEKMLTSEWHAMMERNRLPLSREGTQANQDHQLIQKYILDAKNITTEIVHSTVRRD